jgi:hypothetical protein
MAISDKTDLVVNRYIRRQYPEIDEGVRRYIQDELQRIEQSILSITEASIQVADAAPDNPVKGMVRFNIDPWDPLGDDSEQLVVYNGTAWVAV